MRTIVECSPQFGHTELSSKRLQAVHAAVAAGQVASAAATARGRPGRRPQVDLGLGHEPARLRSRAMKKPSVPSRWGSVWRCGAQLDAARPGPSRAGRPPRKSGCSARNAATTPSFSLGRDRAGRVDERAAGAHARPRRRAGSRPGCCASRAGWSAVLRQRASGAAGERAEVRARRVDEHAVVGAGLVLGRRRRRRAPRRSVAPIRCAVRASAAARPRWRSTATTAPAVLHQRREVGRLAAGRRAQVEHALARPRVEQPRDGHRRARLRHEQPLAPLGRAVGVEGRLEHQPLRQAGRRRGWHRQPRGQLGGGRAQRVGAQRRLGGLVVGGHQRPRAARARASSHHSCGDPLGVRVAQRGRLRRVLGQRLDQRAGLAGGAAQHGVDEAGAAAASPPWRARPTRRPRRGRARGRGRRAGRSRAAAPPARRGSRRSTGARRAPRSRGRAWRGAGRRRRRAGWRAPRSRASRPSRSASPRSARSAHAPSSKTRRRTA